MMSRRVHWSRTTQPTCPSWPGSERSLSSPRLRHTLSDDGDPIDVLVANTRPIIAGAVINVRPIGVLRMEDDGGGDEKIIAVPSPKLTQRYVHVKNYTDLPEITRHQIEHFFIHYKDLEPGKWVKLLGWGDVDEAKRLITEAIERAKTKR